MDKLIYFSGFWNHYLLSTAKSSTIYGTNLINPA